MPYEATSRPVVLSMGVVLPNTITSHDRPLYVFYFMVMRSCTHIAIGRSSGHCPMTSPSVLYVARSLSSYMPIMSLGLVGFLTAPSISRLPPCSMMQNHMSRYEGSSLSSQCDASQYNSVSFLTANVLSQNAPDAILSTTSECVSQ